MCGWKRVTLNETKCVFKVRKKKFLGYKLSTKGIELDTEKVKAVLDFPTPKKFFFD